MTAAGTSPATLEQILADTHSAAGTTPAVPLPFDWHAERKVDPGGLLCWLIPNLLAGMSRVDFERMIDLTDEFGRCELSIRLNGVDMDVRQFLAGIARLIEHTAEVQARKLADDIGFEEIEEAVAEARREVRAVLRGRLADAGVPMGEDGDG